MSSKTMRFLISWIIYVSFIIFVLVNKAIFHFFDLEPRLWLTVVIWMILFFTPAVLIFFMIVWGVQSCKNSVGHFFASLALIIYIIAALLFLAICGFFSILRMDSEEILEDGTILVTEPGFPDPGPSYRCLKVMFFARQPIDGTREYGTDFEDSYVSEETEEASPSRIPEASVTPEADNASPTGTPEQAAQLIYDRMFASQNKLCSFQYNAKGNLYLDLGEGSRESEDAGITTKETLTYDRISKNGKCYLFVHYEYHYDSSGQSLDNTSILNFYAANLETGEVVSADKTSWSDSACDAYYQATGEY
ncbi:MAG: hypothetical protein KH828_08665 [Clostridiales bacterium]|nr:hypothetical protein [Clostridiales bacterium]